MNDTIILVKLSQSQIESAKLILGKRSSPTHALLCGKFGQIFGTEKHCVKYFTAWKEIFKNIFPKSLITDDYEITDFTNTFNLVNIIGEQQMKTEKSRPDMTLKQIIVDDLTEQLNGLNSVSQTKKGLFSRIFSN